MTMRCAVVVASNEEFCIQNVLTQLHRAHVNTCLVVVNGSSDSTKLIADGVGPRLFDSFGTVDYGVRLGPDVPRAVGAYHALRQWRGVQQFVFMDGDLRGSFGPYLADFMAECTSQNADVCWAGRPELGHATRLDDELWHMVLSRLRPELALASPAQVPLMVHARVLRTLSPRLLYHPGLWMAACASQSDLNLRTATFDSRLLGNQAKSSRHQELMQDTLIGDALEGIRLLMQREPDRRWHGRVYNGYHSERRLDLLDEIAQSIQLFV
jgi:hypothetical protein